MVDNRVEREVANVLLKVGVSLPLFRLRVPFTRCSYIFRITMKRPTLGNLIAISKIYLELGTTFEELSKFSRHEELSFMAVNGKRLSKMIALTVCSNGFTRLLVPLLAFLIRHFVSPDIIYHSGVRYATMLSTEDFYPIIISAQKANPMKLRMSQ